MGIYMVKTARHVHTRTKNSSSHTGSETAAYVYRENILCTVIGIAVGLVLGTFLKNFILSVAELESMMFAPETDVWSYVFSAGLTLAFTFLVNGLFFFKLRRLNMAESMKSVE